MDKKRIAYLNSWQRQHKDRINYLVDRGFKAEIQTAAAAAGQSVSSYITGAVCDRMEREKEGKKEGTTL